MRPSERPEFAGWTQLDFLAAMLAELAALNGQMSGSAADNLPYGLAQFRQEIYGGMGPTVKQVYEQQQGGG